MLPSVVSDTCFGTQVSTRFAGQRLALESIKSNDVFKNQKLSLPFYAFKLLW